MREFGTSTTVSFLPLSLYVFALGLGPVVGAPLSETWGRYLVYLLSVPMGSLFVVGAAVTTNFAALCICRFVAGFCFGPSLSIAAGVLYDTWYLAERGLPSTLYILTPFLGPGFG